MSDFVLLLAYELMEKQPELELEEALDIVISKPINLLDQTFKED